MQHFLLCGIEVQKLPEGVLKWNGDRRNEYKTRCSETALEVRCGLGECVLRVMCYLYYLINFARVLESYQVSPCHTSSNILHCPCRELVKELVCTALQLFQQDMHLLQSIRNPILSQRQMIAVFASQSIDRAAFLYHLHSLLWE